MLDMSPPYDLAAQVLMKLYIKMHKLKKIPHKMLIKKKKCYRQMCIAALFTISKN